MSNSKIKIGKNSKIKSFFLFLLLASLFWVLTKFSKEYTARVEAKLNYVNIPVNTLLADENLDQVSFDLFANGFEFLIFRLKKPTIEIPVSKYYEKGDNTILVSSEEFSRLVSDQLSSSNLLRNLSVDTVPIHLNNIISRKIAVRPIAELSYKKGYRPISALISEPDSVTVSGPARVVDTIQYLETIPVSVDEVEKELQIKLSIKQPNHPEVTINTKTVVARQDVDEFTQKTISVPVTLINVPTRLKLKLIPESIRITFTVSLSNFKSITQQDFELVCDYKERNKKENFLVPSLTRQPEGIQNIELGTREIDFLIFK